MLPYGAKPKAAGGFFLIAEKQQELDASHSARDWQVRSTLTEVLANVSYYIPSFGTHAEPFGVGVSLEFGGKHVGPALIAITRYQAGLGAQDGYDAVHAGKMAGYRLGEQLAARARSRL